MAGNTLAKFFATVGFKADTSELDAAIKRIKQEIQSITGSAKASSAAKKLTATQRAAEKVKTETKLLEASKIKSLRLIEDNTAKNIGLDSKHRDEKRKFLLTEKKSAQKLADWNNALAVERKRLNLQEKKSALESVAANSKLAVEGKRLKLKEKDDQRQFSKWNAEIASMRKKLNLKEKADNLAIKTAEKKFIFANNKAEQSLLLTQRRNEELNQKSKQRILENQSKAVVLQHRTVLEQAKAAAAQARTRISEMRGGGGGSVRVGSNGTMTGGVAGLTASGAVGSLGAAGFGMSSYRVGQFSASRMPQFEFLTGSAEEARKQIKFMDTEVERLGLNLIESSEQYKGLLSAGANSIGVKKTQELFTGFSELSVMLGLSSDAQKRGLNAFGQMLSKNQVMA
jgi:hypothetical protein